MNEHLQNKPELELLQVQWKAPENVKAFFTFRSGGVSAGPYGAEDGFNGLNLGTHVNDSPYCVKANRKIVEAFLPESPKWLNQIHSTNVVNADSLIGVPDADAAFTTQSNRVCVVMTADCVPVLFSDEKGEAVAAAHSGWKGLANGILQNTVLAMRQALSDGNRKIYAWIGPHIRQSTFEVGQDVIDYYGKTPLKEWLPNAVVPFGDKYHLSLAYLVTKALGQVGVHEVADCGLDTFSDKVHFYSYRREKVTGRHGAFIYKEK